MQRNQRIKDWADTKEFAARYIPESRSPSCKFVYDAKRSAREATRGSQAPHDTTITIENVDTIECGEYTILCGEVSF